MNERGGEVDRRFERGQTSCCKAFAYKPGILLVASLVEVAESSRDKLGWKRKGLRLRSGVAIHIADHSITEYYSRKVIEALSGFFAQAPSSNRDCDLFREVSKETSRREECVDISAKRGF